MDSLAPCQPIRLIRYPNLLTALTVMTAEQFLFAIAAFAAVVSGAMVVMQRHPVYSALFLVTTFCALAVMYLLLGAQFIAAVQVIVYAGAIMVLFLFVIMLLNLDRPLETQAKLKHQRTVGLILSTVLLCEMGYLLFRGMLQSFPQQSIPPNFGTVEEVARVLFRDFALAFEATSLVLLVGMIGVIVLAKRHLDEKKTPANGVEEMSPDEIAHAAARERVLSPLGEE
jgi:NADH-quinone oxidoreductase subunit J